MRLPPRYIIDELGPFDLDPCAVKDAAYKMAITNWNVQNNKQWFGRVWLFPQSVNVDEYIDKMIRHDNGIAMLSARVNSAFFHDKICKYAKALFFIRGYIKLCLPDGELCNRTLPEPMMLVAYGENNMNKLKNCSLYGSIVYL